MAKPKIHVGGARELIYHTEGMGKEKKVKDKTLNFLTFYILGWEVVGVM